MTIDATSEIYYDPYDHALNRDPYPMLRRLREEAPLYYNAERDFYVLSRFADVSKGLVDHETFQSGRGAILDWIKARVIGKTHKREIPSAFAMTIALQSRNLLALTWMSRMYSLASRSPSASDC